MKQFVEGEERRQVTLLPECLERLALRRRIDAVQAHDVLALLGVEVLERQVRPHPFCGCGLALTVTRTGGVVANFDTGLHEAFRLSAVNGIDSVLNLFQTQCPRMGSGDSRQPEVSVWIFHHELPQELFDTLVLIGQVHGWWSEAK